METGAKASPTTLRDATDLEAVGVLMVVKADAVAAMERTAIESFMVIVWSGRRKENDRNCELHRQVNLCGGGTAPKDRYLADVTVDMWPQRLPAGSRKIPFTHSLSHMWLHDLSHFFRKKSVPQTTSPPYIAGNWQ